MRTKSLGLSATLLASALIWSAPVAAQQESQTRTMQKETQTEHKQKTVNREDLEKAVSHLKDAYVASAKAHSNLAMSKWKEAERDVREAQDKIKDASEVDNLPAETIAMIRTLTRHVDTLSRTVEQRTQSAAQEAGALVVTINKDMDRLRMTLGTPTGGGGGEERKIEEQRKIDELQDQNRKMEQQRKQIHKQDKK